MNLLKRFTMVAALGLTLAAGSCDQDDAKVVEKNLIKAADNFEVNRRIVFYNGMQDIYLLEIAGRCAMELGSSGRSFNVICKVGPSDYKRHTLVLSDNVTAFVEQLDAVHASAYHYRVTFKPQALIGDVDFRGSAEELTTNSSEANQ